jgi:hypothetical protein
VNLALVGKAVSVGEVIARGDSGLLPKIKTAMGNLKLDEVSSQVAQHVESIGREVERSVREKHVEIAHAKEELRKAFKKTPDEQRAHLFGKGFGSLFGGVAMMIVFYVISRKVAFNFPPDLLARVPFDLYAMIGLAWLFGLIPALSGVGQIIGAFMIPKTTRREAEVRKEPHPATAPMLDPSTAESLFEETPPSVTEHTTAHLDYEAVPRRERQPSRG